VWFPFMYRAAGSMVGKGISDFITDWDKVSATVRNVSVESALFNEACILRYISVCLVR